MAKITLDRDTFKALASDTRLDILRALDGKNLGLNDIAKATSLNKATLHEHLSKLHEAGLVKKKEREGHKWVYYKLSWKGESLLHPENTRIVVLFSTTFIALAIGIIQIVWYIKGNLLSFVSSYGDGYSYKTTPAPEGVNNSAILDEMISTGRGEGANNLIQDPMLLYIAIACFIVFTVVFCIAIWRFQKNKTPKL